MDETRKKNPPEWGNPDPERWAWYISTHRWILAAKQRIKSLYSTTLVKQSNKENPKRNIYRFPLGKGNKSVLWDAYAYTQAYCFPVNTYSVKQRTLEITMYVKVSAYHSSYYLTTLQGLHGHTLLMAVAVDSVASKPMGNVSWEHLIWLLYAISLLLFSSVQGLVFKMMALIIKSFNLGSTSLTFIADSSVPGLMDTKNNMQRWTDFKRIVSHFSHSS